MSTPRINYSAPVTRSLVGKGVFSSSPFMLVDVGASGGIEQYWRVFQPALRAVGFDPLVKECERLNRLEASPDIRYFAYFVGAEGYDTMFPPSVASDPRLGWNDQAYERTSAVRAQKIMSMSFTQRFNNEDPEIVLTEQRTSLDQFFSRSPVDTVDFVKVDTDGHDYEVLLGARKLAAEKNVLGFFIECQLHGITHPHSNLLSNIDRLMREQGFSMFDLEIYRYTRATLPGRFVYDIPAQTREGQVVWGDALYLRDVTAEGYEERWTALDPLKLLKLVCLHEIFGMPDCAAEVLVTRRNALRNLVDVGALLDILTREVDPAYTNFREYDAAFERSPTSFYPRRAGNTSESSHRLLSALTRRVRRLVRS